MKKKDSIPGYIKTIVKDHNKITSGRKNFEKHHRRILETLKLVKKYFNLKNRFENILVFGLIIDTLFTV